MNAFTRQPAPIRIESNAKFVETSPGHWTVTLGGRDEDSRSISKDGFSFIAWIGHASRHWCFSKALKACADDIQYRRDMAVHAQLEHDAAIASLMRMTPAQKARLIETLEAERDRLDYAPSGVNVVALKAVKNKQIASLRRVSGETGMVPVTGKERPMLRPEAASTEARFESASLHQPAKRDPLSFANYLKSREA